MRRAFLLTLTVLLIGLSVRAANFVDVPGSNTKYPAQIETTVAGKVVRLSLTGTAMRKKLFLNVYALGSYVQEGEKVKSAEDLAAMNVPKRLHLVMERTVDGTSLAEAFRSAIRMNYPEPTFTEEVNMLVKFMKSTSVRKGEHINLTHVPGIGLHINASGKADFMIRNTSFSKAVWDIYLGSRNLGDEIKKGLTNRL